MVTRMGERFKWRDRGGAKALLRTFRRTTVTLRERRLRSRDLAGTDAPSYQPRPRGRLKVALVGQAGASWSDRV